MRKVKVKGSKNKYTAFIKNNSFDEIGSLLENYHYKNYVIIYDSKVKIDPILKLKLEPHILEVDVSEKIKNKDGVEGILNFFFKNQIYKEGTLVIAIGGGVLLDLVGFSCSIYMRGIDVAYIPTTLMAMVDVSIGSKNAIHLKERKNILGTYNDPVFVLIDPTFIKTLPKREIRSGLVEIIKIAYIANYKIMSLLENIYDYNYNWEPVIYMSLKLKNDLISVDFHDKGVRKFLNFGHTFGHAIETYYDYEKYTHGEAVAIGMCISYPNMKLIKDLQSFGISTEMDYSIDYKKMYEIMESDKKRNSNKGITIVVLQDVCTPALDELSSELDLVKKIERLKIVNAKVK